MPACYNETDSMNRPRLFFAVISTIIEEVLLVVIVVWGLPQMGINIPVWIAAPLGAVWLYYSIYTYRKGTKALNAGNLIGLPDMVGTRGRTVGILNPDGWVRIRGELWSATSVSGCVNPDTDVIVTGQKRLKLEVRPIESPNDSDTKR
jgi:membrane-bound ClpP family serine protease